MNGGYMGRILRVDLSSGKIEKENLKEGFARKFLGGRGFGARILYDEIKAGTDPFSPENVIVFATGPLTGTRTPESGRHTVISKSPLTGGIGTSTSGGFWGYMLKKAGFDAIVVRGSADKPVYLWVEDGKAEIRSAEHLWGKLVSEVDDIIREETEKRAKVLQIGPAGERKSLISAVMNDKYRAAGRCGLGAVMGSKKLRAIAVSGDQEIQIANPDKFDEAVERARGMIDESDVTKEGGLLNSYGTDGIMNIINASGLLPTKNFQTGVFDRAENISGERMAETILERRVGCYNCSIRCGRWVKAGFMDYSIEGESLEYENVWAFGADCEIGDLNPIAVANYLCNEFGFDTISAGNTIAFAMELMERGIISEKDTGIDLKFGDGRAMIEMLNMMARREGFGDVLADGTRKAAERIGGNAGYYAIHVKGLELPAYDPRGAYGMGLNYATSNRGAAHVNGYTISPEIFGIPSKVDPYDYSDSKVELTIFLQNITAAIDSSVTCLFNVFAFGENEFGDMISGATGWEYSGRDFLETGERVYAVERLFNSREGLSSKDDNLPVRFLKEPMPEGPAKGNTVPLEKMLSRYYEIRGYSDEGVPTPEKLKELEL